MNLKNILLLCLILSSLLNLGCKKDYYKDTGRHTAEFNGSVMDYLESKPELFSSVVSLIKSTGLENTFRNENITFFAPADSSIRFTLKFVNNETAMLGLPEVTRLDQIAPEVWRKYLTRYLFKEKKSMNDYRQIDPTNLAAYSGQIYESYDGGLMNVGVVHDDAGGVKYAGYRHLMISFIPSPSAPLDFTTWFSADVASVNIAPKNGYIHALKYPNHYFGFVPDLFFEDALAAGIKP